jgi:hypothetical protein
LFWGMADSSIGERRSGAFVRFFRKRAIGQKTKPMPALGGRPPPRVLGNQSSRRPSISPSSPPSTFTPSTFA